MRRALPLLLLALAAIAAAVLFWPTGETGTPADEDPGRGGTTTEERRAGSWQGEAGETTRAPASGELPVRVVDAQGAAVPRGTVYASIDGEPTRLEFEGGLARLPLGRESLAAAAHADGRWSAWKQLTGEAMRGAQELLLTLADADGTVSVRVLLDDGSAAPAPRLLLASVDPRADASLPLDGWTAGSDGTVRIGGLAPGSYAATVTQDGCGRWTAQWQVEAGATLERTVKLSRTATLEGVVIGPEGPVVGARLLLAPAEMARMPFSGLDRFRTYGQEPPEPPDDGLTTSGEGGRFLFPSVRPGEYLLLAHAEGLLPYVHGRDFEILPGTQTQAGRIELVPGSRVVATVQDSAGQPLAGAQVRWRASSEGVLAQVADIWGDTVQAGEDGVAVLEPLPGGMLVVEARDPSVAPAETVVEIPAQGSHVREVVLRVGAGASLAGRVLRAADAAPIEGATVALVRTESVGASFFGGNAEQVTTGADGSFRFERQSAGSYLVRASHPSLAPTSVGPVELGEGAADPVELRLGAGATLEVLARDGDGAPFPDAMVSLGSTSLRLNEVATTDASGSARFERMPAGDYQVALLGTDVEQAAASGDLDIAMLFVTLEDGETRRLEIGGGGDAADVEGRVLRGGEAVAGATLVAVLPSGAKTARTGEDGSYRLEKVPVGSHVLMVQLAGGLGGGSHYSGLEVPSSAPLVHDVLLPASGVEVVVSDSEGGAPVAGIPVSLRPADGSHISGADFGVTDPDGVARFGAVAPGEYVVAAGRATLPMLAGEELSRFAARQERVVIPSGSERTERVELALGAGATFRARVSDRDGNYLPGAHLYYLDADGQPLAVMSMTGTNAKGVAQLTGLPAGPGRILVRHAQHGVKEVSVDLQAGQVAKQEVMLEGGTRLLVEVEDADGRAVAGVLAVALDGRGAPLSTTWTMAESQSLRGAFFQGTAQALGPLPPGRYTVRLVRPGKPTVEHPVTLDGSPEMRVRLRYDP